MIKRKYFKIVIILIVATFGASYAMRAYLNSDPYLELISEWISINHEIVSKVGRSPSLIITKRTIFQGSENKDAYRDYVINVKGKNKTLIIYLRSDDIGTNLKILKTIE